jgi:hypothetical protein
MNPIPSASVERTIFVPAIGKKVTQQLSPPASPEDPELKLLTQIVSDQTEGILQLAGRTQILHIKFNSDEKFKQLESLTIAAMIKSEKVYNHLVVTATSSSFINFFTNVNLIDEVYRRHTLPYFFSNDNVWINVKATCYYHQSYSDDAGFKIFRELVIQYYGEEKKKPETLLACIGVSPLVDIITEYAEIFHQAMPDDVKEVLKLSEIENG